MQLQCGRFVLDLTTAKIMGVLNCTPDSFSDGGKYQTPAEALRHAEVMLKEGADIIDIGAESTRPGAVAVAPTEEIKRLTPIVRELIAWGEIPVSIDTRHPETMRAMLELGADLINDVRGLEAEGALAAVAESACAICLMHMRGLPDTMQNDTQYDNVVREVQDYLQSRVAACEAQGIARTRLLVDPGFGFAKTPAQNMALVAHLCEFASTGAPVLLGVSRKSTIGHYLGGREVSERMIGSVALALLGVERGARIVRVHDVQATKDALRMYEALQQSASV